MKMTSNVARLYFLAIAPDAPAGLLEAMGATGVAACAICSGPIADTPNGRQAVSEGMSVVCGFCYNEKAYELDPMPPELLANLPPCFRGERDEWQMHPVGNDIQIMHGDGRLIATVHEVPYAPQFAAVPDLFEALREQRQFTPSLPCQDSVRFCRCQTCKNRRADIALEKSYGKAGK